MVFFWPLAFAAFGNALKVFPRWYSGDLDGARAASKRARTLGIIALSIGALSTAWCLSSAFTGPNRNHTQTRRGPGVVTATPRVANANSPHPPQ
ncbi:hypothetical protein RW1_006_00670 [Rhodococcus wratislaviensis NBRC 100605]|uniref:Uncharacterized protein n=1 Tax=Rhodococcus wratislaviensis NBRC 100605 TaxID=1219028 RepID=X0PLD1_RHOWR|nr:hypothetical protein RW1_006_00670 [Rhodococcus wratislaviensis NBRC 100605]